MTQQVDDRFILLCSEIVATLNGNRGGIEPEHIAAIRDRLLEPLAALRAKGGMRRGAQPLTTGDVDRVWDIFTDITGIDEPR